MNKRECDDCNMRMAASMCGQGFTEYECKGCHGNFSWHNTCTPIYCNDCAEKLNRCQRCGAKMGIKVYNPTKKNVLYMLRESNAIEDVWDKTSLTNARRAWDYVMMYDSMNVQIIKEAHRLLMANQDIEYKYKGDWRDVPVWIGGEMKGQPKPVIDSLMRDWVKLTNTVDKNYDPVTLHLWFESIHPFIDGNGRIGRILLNWHLVKRNSAPLLIYTYEDRQTYYRLFPSYRAKEREKMMDIALKLRDVQNGNHRLS